MPLVHRNLNTTSRSLVRLSCRLELPAFVSPQSGESTEPHDNACPLGCIGLLFTREMGVSNVFELRV